MIYPSKSQAYEAVDLIRPLLDSGDAVLYDVDGNVVDWRPFRDRETHHAPWDRLVVTTRFYREGPAEYEVLIERWPRNAVAEDREANYSHLAGWERRMR